MKIEIVETIHLNREACDWEGMWRGNKKWELRDFVGGIETVREVFIREGHSL